MHRSSLEWHLIKSNTTSVPRLALSKLKQAYAEKDTADTGGDTTAGSGQGYSFNKAASPLIASLGTDCSKFLSRSRLVFNFDILCNRAIFTLLQLYLVKAPFIQSGMIVVFIGVVLFLFSAEL